MSAEMVKATLNGQFNIIIPKHRADRPEWYTEAGWEKPRLKRMYEVITDQLIEKANSVVYYVGAEEGEMPALCQMWGAKVVMFEPNPKVWSNIKAIWDANKLEAPERMFVGFASNVSNQPYNGTTDFPKCAYGEVIGDHGFMNLSENDDGRTGEWKIDDVVVGGCLPPTLLTMDVEGSEWEVLRGAEQVLREHKPVIVLSLHPEFMYEMYHEYAFDCRRWIKDLGYTEELLDYQHEVHLIYTPTEG